MMAGDGSCNNDLVIQVSRPTRKLLFFLLNGILVRYIRSIIELPMLRRMQSGAKLRRP